MSHTPQTQCCNKCYELAPDDPCYYCKNEKCACHASHIPEENTESWAQKTVDRFVAQEKEQEEGWEEQFDKMCMDTSALAGLTGGRKIFVKDFIRKLLVDKEARVVNMLERMKTKLTDEDTKDLGQALWGYFDFSGMEESKASRIHEIIGSMIVIAKNNTLDAVKSKIIGNSK